jgi:transcriptional regulator with XRE-family HTH domain
VANRLKMAMVEAIAALVARGWSQRRIARELGVNRETVGRYVAMARHQGEAAEGASAKPGVCEVPLSPDIDPPKPAKAPLGSYPSGQVQAAVARSAPDGSFYSVAFQAELRQASYPGVSRAAHFQEANESLLRMMGSDAQFAQSMKDCGISLERTAR